MLASRGLDMIILSGPWCPWPVLRDKNTFKIWICYKLKKKIMIVNTPTSNVENNRFICLNISFKSSLVLDFREPSTWRSNTNRTWPYPCEIFFIRSTNLLAKSYNERYLILDNKFKLKVYMYQR